MIHSPTAVKRWDQHNYRMGILRAAFDQLGMALAHPSLVLATFVHTLGGSNTLVGLLGPLRFGGWLLPQVLVASWIQPLPRKLPYCIALAVIRGLCYAFMGAAVVLIPRTDLLLAMFFALFLISRLAGGSGAVARWDVIGKIVPPDRRNAFFSQSSFWGGALAFVAGFLVRYVLDERHTWSFRFNYTLLFFLAFTSFGLGAMVFFQVHEPVLTDGRDQASGFARLLREASHLLQRDRRYRRFLVVLALLGMARIANPFYVVFAQEVLQTPVAMTGSYLSALALASTLSNLLWNRMGSWTGVRFVHLAATLTLLAPISALVIPAMGLPVASLLGTRDDLRGFLFGLVFLFMGFANSSTSIAKKVYLLEISPSRERAIYLGVINTVLGFVNFLPILGGLIADWFGFRPVFLLATGMVFLGLLASWRLK